MRIQIVSIGDELLIGQTVNTNAAWMGEHLTLDGWVVGGVEEIIIEVIANEVVAVEVVADQVAKKCSRCNCKLKWKRRTS